jgi:hypothetical protein
MATFGRGSGAVEPCSKNKEGGECCKKKFCYTLYKNVLLKFF